MAQTNKQQRYKAAMVRGVIYFTLVFGIGFVLGTIRVLWLVPQTGERYAELIESPLMLVAIYFSARLAVRRFPATSAVDYLLSGAIALVLTLSIEFSVVLSLRGLSLTQYLDERDPVAGAVYLVMLAVFTFMPWLLGRSRVAAQ